MELNLENLKKYKKGKQINAIKNSRIGKTLIGLLNEEIEYLNHWMKTENISPVGKSVMKERIEFIEIAMKDLK